MVEIRVFDIFLTHLEKKLLYLLSVSKQSLPFSCRDIVNSFICEIGMKIGATYLHKFYVNDFDDIFILFKAFTKMMIVGASSYFLENLSKGNGIKQNIYVSLPINKQKRKYLRTFSRHDFSKLSKKSLELLNGVSHLFSTKYPTYSSNSDLFHFLKRKLWPT